MTERYDAVAARKYTVNGEEKSSFTNIGVAFKMKERDGYSLRLHCLPAPVDGEYSILLFPPKPRDDQRQDSGQRGQSSGGDYGGASGGESRGGGQRDLDDDIPF